MADNERMAEHSQEGDEGDEDLAQRVGGDELAVEVEPAPVDSESRHLRCTRLQRTAWNDVQVEGVASTHCRQLDDVTTTTCSNRTSDARNPPT